MHDWRIYPNADAVAQAAADYLAERIQTLLAAKPHCHVALPGGTTPAACLRLLATRQLPWERIHWYLGDERCLPPGDPERNDTMIRDCLWSQAAIPPENCHLIPAELGPEQAAANYSRVLSEVDPLDLVLLGMGEDGHTASLFPGNAALTLTDAAVPVFDAPKPPPERVSMSVSALQAAAERVVLITGAGKAAAVQAMLRDAYLPINGIGRLICLADEAAAGQA